MATKLVDVGNSLTRQVLPDTLRDARRGQSAELIAAIDNAAPNALRIVTGLLENPKVSAKVRADIGFKLLDRAGYVAPRAAAPKGIDIPLHEMSVTDLRDLAAQLGAEIADRATVVSAPNTPAAPIKDVDSLM